MEYLMVRNFDKYQTHRDGRPMKWVKLYTSILDDFDFAQLPDATKAHFMLILALAAKLGNKLPNNEHWLTQKLSTTEPIDIQLLVSKGYLVEYQPINQSVEIRSESVENCSGFVEIRTELNPTQKSFRSESVEIRGLEKRREEKSREESPSQPNTVNLPGELAKGINILKAFGIQKPTDQLITLVEGRSIKQIQAAIAWVLAEARAGRAKDPKGLLIRKLSHNSWEPENFRKAKKQPEPAQESTNTW